MDPADDFYGSSTRAHGTKQLPPSPPVNSSDRFSCGSYGINGFLYYQDPAQMPPKINPSIAAGIKLVAGANGSNMKDYWYEDVTTLDGGTVPASVYNTPSIKAQGLPAGFGSAA